MILTNCAACAAPLAHDHKKRCSRCKTRYCNEACQRDHWERGGHEALCRRIKRAGGAEQYHADKKYSVFGGAHPTTAGIERHLGLARAALRAREQPSDEETSSQSK